MALPPGSLVGPYQLVRLLGTGGMAEVHLARSAAELDDRLVALKVVAAGDPKIAARFRREAQLAAAMRHRNVAHVHDAGVADGHCYLALELIHGATLREVLASAARDGVALPLGFGVGVVLAAAAGLHHAHERIGPAGPLGIVHCDVSPSNLMLGHRGEVKLIDFGIARARGSVEERGLVRGKPGYMSPEQLTERPVDRRSDVFSLGIVLYEVTTQARAFTAATDLEIARRAVSATVIPPAAVRSGYPAALAEVIARALAPAPGDRFPTAEAFGFALDRAAALAGLDVNPALIVHVMRALVPRPRARGTGGHPTLPDDVTTRPRRPRSHAENDRPRGALPAGSEVTPSTRLGRQG